MLVSCSKTHATHVQHNTCNTTHATHMQYNTCNTHAIQHMQHTSSTTHATHAAQHATHAVHAPDGIPDLLIVGHLVYWGLALHLYSILELFVKCINTTLCVGKYLVNTHSVNKHTWSTNIHGQQKYMVKHTWAAHTWSTHTQSSKPSRDHVQYKKMYMGHNHVYMQCFNIYINHKLHTPKQPLQNRQKHTHTTSPDMFLGST